MTTEDILMKLKRILSLSLSIAISLVFVLGVLVPAGVTVSFAKASSTFKNELWLLCDYDFGLSKGTRFDLNENTDAAPFAHDSGTAYIPISAPAKYKGATVTIDGDVVTVTQSRGAVSTLTVGETKWSGGEFLLPVVMVDGDVYLSILSVNDVFGTKSIYNKDIGAIIFYTNYSTNSNSLSVQIDTLGSLLFDRPKAATIYSDLLSYSGSADTHPRLLATDETFAEMRELVLNPSTDTDSYNYKVFKLVSGLSSSFTAYFTYDEITGKTDWISEEKKQSVRQPHYLYDENGNRLVGVSTYSYVDENGEIVELALDTKKSSNLGDGYDYGGRSSVDTFTSKLKYLAILWQVYGEQKYADAFYLLAMELGKWEHWGEGHFLDCADGSVEFALGLDWIYHAFDDEPEKRDEMAAILYRLGMMKGYYAIVCDSLYKKGNTASFDFTSNNQYGTHASLSGQQANYLVISKRAGNDGWRTINRTNNWQTVCGGGMIISALFLAEYEEYRDNATFVIEQHLFSNERCLQQYAPDGAYIESPGYWGYGTNTLMRTIGALQSSLGTDYGLSDIVGLYDSFYYTIGIADGRYYMWNYHDSGGYRADDPGLGSGRVDYSYFYLASRIFDDPTLAKLRDRMIFEADEGFDLTVMDAIYYSSDLSDGAHTEDVALDYNFKAIDTATLRSGFETDSVFTGLHVGPNSVSHGDMDCGNFTLTMGGVKWVSDPGSENYNVSGFWNGGENGTRYKLYCKSLEGHSTVMIRNNSSIPRGQTYTSTSSNYATIDEFYSDTNGGFAISDMTTEYGSNCISGKRGVLLTNSRTTVVLQDEITFNNPADLTWVLNINIRNYQNISEDGKTIRVKAQNKQGDIVVLRMTLISDNADLRFRKMDTYETVFSSTVTAHSSGDDLARDPVPRICIEANGVTSFNVAVVFQMEEHNDEVVAYNYTEMANWRTDTDEWIVEANKDINYGGAPVIPETKLGTFRSINGKLNSAFESNDYIKVGELLWDSRDYLLNYNDKNAEVAAEARKYREYRNRYNQILRALNSGLKDLLFD